MGFKFTWICTKCIASLKFSPFLLNFKFRNKHFAFIHTRSKIFQEQEKLLAKEIIRGNIFYIFGRVLLAKSELIACPWIINFTLKNTLEEPSNLYWLTVDTFQGVWLYFLDVKKEIIVVSSQFSHINLMLVTAPLSFDFTRQDT